MLVGAVLMLFTAVDKLLQHATWAQIAVALLAVAACCGVLLGLRRSSKTWATAICSIFFVALGRRLDGDRHADRLRVLARHGRLYRVRDHDSAVHRAGPHGRRHVAPDPARRADVHPARRADRDGGPGHGR